MRRVDQWCTTPGDPSVTNLTDTLRGHAQTGWRTVVDQSRPPAGPADQRSGASGRPGWRESAMRSRCSHDPARVIARQPLFASLSEAECTALVERSLCRGTRCGEVLFREGEACRGLYLVVEGEVRLYRANRSGQEQVIGFLGHGESLGEVSLFDEGPYLASARVTEGGRVLFLPFEQVHALYHSHPEVAHAVVRELGNRVRSLAALVDRLALQSVPTRVAWEVLRHARESGSLRSGAAFRLPRTQEEMAAEVGTTREGISRALRDLRTRGAIQQRGARIEILNPALLHRLAGEGQMLQAFIIVVREGFEAFLIVAITLAYLRRTGRASLGAAVYGGIGAAVLASAALGWVLMQGANLPLWEGAMGLLALPLMVGLVVHLWREGPSLRGRIEERIQASAARPAGGAAA
jgi:CRP/FNR family transcriptional regulator